MLFIRTNLSLNSNYRYKFRLSLFLNFQQLQAVLFFENIQSSISPGILLGTITVSKLFSSLIPIII
jgi:hypothetical protein